MTIFSSITKKWIFICCLNQHLCMCHSSTFHVKCHHISFKCRKMIRAATAHNIFTFCLLLLPFAFAFDYIYKTIYFHLHRLNETWKLIYPFMTHYFVIKLPHKYTKMKWKTESVAQQHNTPTTVQHQINIKIYNVTVDSAILHSKVHVAGYADCAGTTATRMRYMRQPKCYAKVTVNSECWGTPVNISFYGKTCSQNKITYCQLAHWVHLFFKNSKTFRLQITICIFFHFFFCTSFVSDAHCSLHFFFQAIEKNS